MVNVSGFGVIAPGSSSASWFGLRPFSGSDCIVCAEMTSPTVAVSVCRTGDSAVTSTVSSSPPTSILKSRRAICFASSVNGFVDVTLKPVSSDLTTYVPIGTDVIV